MAFKVNKTFDLVSLSHGKNLSECKWVFIVKVNPNGLVAQLKAQLVAKQYSQTYNVNYFETFSLVAKYTSMRLFISLVASFDQPFCQLNVKNTFLHGDLLKEVYMEQPSGFIAQREYKKVC